MAIQTAVNYPPLGATADIDTISSGLTLSSGTLTNDLITGKAGGQTIVGDTASGGDLTLSSTTHATKGSLLFGTSEYSESTNRMGLGASGTLSNRLVLADDLGDIGTSAAATLTIGGSGTNTQAALGVGQSSTNLLRFRWQYDATAASAIGFLETRLANNPLQINASTVTLRAADTTVATVSSTALTLAASIRLVLDATNTAAGTTGAQTINKPSGTVNFAAAATTLVVTNSLVSTASLVFCVVRTNDSTATIKNCVPASGSFTITLTAAATAETSVGFLVVN